MFSLPFISADKKPPGKILLNPRVPWPYAIACSLYFLLAYQGFVTALPIFAKLFEGLGVDLPLPTRILMATYWWLFPVFFLGAAVLTIVKQFVRLDELLLRFTNLILIFVGAVLVPLIVIAVYLPLFELTWKLQHVHPIR